MKRTLFFLIVLANLIICFYISRGIDRHFPRTEVEDLLYLPSGHFLKGAALGFDDILGDLLWIKALGYFGGHSVTDQDYSWLAHILDIVTTLDPISYYPYEFGGIILSTEVSDVDKSIALMEKGMKNIPNSHPRYWFLPFFIAFNHMYHKNDYKTAALYLEQAAGFPQSPEYLPLLVSKLYADADSPEVAVTFLQEVIKGTKKPELKAKLVQRLHQVIHASNIKFLDRAVIQFYQKFHGYPKKINELVDKKIIPFIPADPRGGEYFISQETHSVLNTKKAADLKVFIDKENSILNDKKKSILNMVPQN